MNGLKLPLSNREREERKAMVDEALKRDREERESDVEASVRPVTLRVTFADGRIVWEGAFDPRMVEPFDVDKDGRLRIPGVVHPILPPYRIEFGEKR